MLTFLVFLETRLSCFFFFFLFFMVGGDASCVIVVVFCCIFVYLLWISWLDSVGFQDFVPTSPLLCSFVESRKTRVFVMDGEDAFPSAVLLLCLFFQVR